MDDKNKNISEKEGAGPDRRRPKATIDLTAQEIKKEKARETDNLEAGKTENPDGTEGASSEFSLPSGIIAGFVGGFLVLLASWIWQYANSDSTRIEGSLKARIDILDQKLSSLASAAKNGTDAATLNKLVSKLENNFDKKLSSINSKIDEQINAAVRKSFSESGDVIKAAKTDEIQKLLDSNLTGINEQFAQLQKKINTLSSLEQKIPGLRSEISDLKQETVRQQSINEQVSSFSQKVEDVDRKLLAIEKSSLLRQRESSKTALSVAFAGLKRAADLGKPFDLELETVKQLAPDITLSELEPYQNRGVPSLRDLEKSFVETLRKALHAERFSENKTIWDKFKTNAASMVNFRRTGNIPGEDTEAILARMEYQIKAGNFMKALQEGRSLKGRPLLITQSWLDQLHGRLKLESMLQKIEMKLLSSLSASKQGEQGTQN